MAGREKKEEKSRLGKNQRREQNMRDVAGARSQTVRRRDSKKVRKGEGKKSNKKQQSKNL